MKKVLTLLLIFTLALSVVNVSAADVITVTVSEEKVEFDVPPMTVNDRTMVPLRAIFEKLGAEVAYDDATRGITAKKGNITVKLAVDSDKMYVNEREVILDVPAFETDGRTLVPVRAISEAFGCKVIWHEEEKLVEIVDEDKKLGTISGFGGKKDIYDYEMNYLVNSGYTAEQAIATLSEVKMMQLKAEEYGVFLDEEDLKIVENNLESNCEQFGSKELFEMQLEALGLTYDQYREIIKMSDHAAKFQKQMVQLGAFNATSDEEAKEYFDKNFIKAKHILISDKTKAYEVSNALKKGKKFEDYRELCEDPGSKAKPDGYVFAKVSEFSDDNIEKQYLQYFGYAMVEEFEKGASELKIGQISQPVETAYGYHIINRVALTEADFEENKAYVKETLDTVKFQKTIAEWMSKCTVE